MAVAFYLPFAPGVPVNKPCQIQMADGKPCGRLSDNQTICVMHSGEDKQASHGAFKREIADMLAGTSKFARGLDFTGFQFVLSAPAGFKNWNCEKPVSFDRTRFSSGVSFEGATFKQRVSFQLTTFAGELNLRGTHFEGDADFVRSNSAVKTDARDIHFAGEADFSGANIVRCDFSNATFRKKASFLEVDFSEREAVFWGVKFLEGAAFSRAKVRRKLDFSSALFQAGSDSPGLALDRLHFPDSEEREERVILSGSNTVHPGGLLISLVGTDIRKLSITDVHWFREGSRFVLWDEIALSKARKQAPPGHTHEQAANTYRQLQKSFADGFDHGNAEDCASGVMEMKRLDPREPWGYKWILRIYRFASFYGTNFWRALLVLLAIPTLCGLLFCIPGVELKNRPLLTWTLNPSAWRSTVTSFIHALEVGTFQREQRYPAMNDWAHVIGMIESVLVPGQLALFLLALKRRMKR